MTVHRGDLNRAIRGLTQALLELEAYAAVGRLPATDPVWVLVAKVDALWWESREYREALYPISERPLETVTRRVAKWEDPGEMSA